MDKWHGLVFIALFAVAMIVGAHTFYHLWRRRNRLPELQRQRGEPVWQPPLMPDAGAVAPGEAIRCVLTEWAPGLKTRVVAIDIGQDAIWVRQREVWTTYRVPRFDPNKNALVASVRRAEVTATPATWEATRQPVFGESHWDPVLIVRVPGLPPLTIGCREYIDPHWNSPPSSLRFRWRGDVPCVKAPAYWASDGDWLPLVENFGLAPYLEDKASAQPHQGAREWIPSPQEVKAAAKSRRGRGPLGLIVLAGFALLFFVIGGVDFAQYRAGTPTTATVTYCGTGKGSGCTGTWSIGGVSQTGPIKSWFGHPSVGSSLDVRVSGGQARTPTSCLVFVVAGGCVLAFSIFMFVATRDRTTGPGSLVEKP